MDRIKESAKAIAALVGSIATALLAVYTGDTSVGKVLTVVAVVATAVSTWAVTNVPSGVVSNDIALDHLDGE